MFPKAKAGFPAQLSKCVIKAVTLDFPLVPVIAIQGFFSSRAPSSISPRRRFPSFLAF